MGAQFQKVSEEQFLKDLEDSQNLNMDDPVVRHNAIFAYERLVSLPKRSTSGSAGYDFVSPIAFKVDPGEKVIVPTGIRVQMSDFLVLKVYPRSGLGFRYQMGLANTVGIIDSDYYWSENEGHIMIAVENRGKRTINIGGGDRFAQGIFVPFIVTDDDNAKEKRNGGMGSTGY